MGSVIDGPPTTRRWFLTQERFFRVLSSVVKVSRWEEGTSGRNLKRTRLLVEILEGKVQGSRRTDVDDSHFGYFYVLIYCWLVK